MTIIKTYNVEYYQPYPLISLPPFFHLFFSLAFSHSFNFDCPPFFALCPFPFLFHYFTLPLTPSLPPFYYHNFIPHTPFSLMPQSHTLASISYKVWGEEYQMRGTRGRNKDLSFQHKNKTKTWKPTEWHMLCCQWVAGRFVIRPSAGLSVFAMLVPASFLNSNYRLIGVFSLLGCCSCGWFTVIRPHGTHRLTLPITY